MTRGKTAELSVSEVRSGAETSVSAWLFEIVRFRDLLWFLTWRDIRARYAQSVLGIGWAVIQPVFQMIVFTIILGRLAGIPSDGAPYALFSFVALVPWTFFSNSLTGATQSLIANSGMLGKVYFPRIVLPLSAVAGKSVDFMIASVVLGMMLIWFGMTPGISLIALPVLILITVMTACGLGFWLSALAVQYRDVAYSLQFFVQIGMYVSPVVYATSMVPPIWQPVYTLNPMVGVIEGARSMLLGTIPFPTLWVVQGALISLALFLSGLLFFRRQERFFADVA